MVAVLALIHSLGAGLRQAIIWFNRPVLLTRDSRIARRLPAWYRQLTLRPARLMQTSLSCTSATHAPGVSPSQEVTRQGSERGVRLNTVTTSPSS